MPFESGTDARRRIAVVGAGISGMGAAYHLAAKNTVCLLEAEPRLGGHARTVIAGKRGDQPVDTGFIVFNEHTYPNMVRLFDELDVPVAESNMSFGVSAREGRFEYALNSIDSIFAQRRRAFDPRFLRMVRDIMAFNGILDWNDNHQWYTVDGGSVEYVRRLGAAMEARGVDIRLNARTEAVRRTSLGVEIKVAGADWEPFDDVVFATHADDTLRLLTDATGVEQTALSAVTYQPNRAVLHADTNAMPKRRKVWSSWCHVASGPGADAPIELTYWMNSLQPIPQDDPLFVTLNAQGTIREELIHDETVFRHPVFDQAAVTAQDTVRAINGQNRTWFCGAWMRHGFHEDGLASAVEVANLIEAQSQMGLAAE